MTATALEILDALEANLRREPPAVGPALVQAQALRDTLAQAAGVAEVVTSAPGPQRQPWVWPIRGIPPRITQHFGAPVKYGRHEGIDIDCYDDAARQLCEVVSVAPGTITLIWSWKGGRSGEDAYGNHVIVVNDDGYTVAYCHLSQIAPGLVELAHVAAGQTLGVGGNTGNSRGAHLHLTVTHPGAPPVYVFGQRAVDPEPLLLGEANP